jgi:hypothetical protein
MWTKDGPHIERLLFAGTSLDWARAPVCRICQETATGRLTVRQRARVLAEWPKKLARSDAVINTVKRFGSMRLVRGSRAPWFHVHILAAVPIAQSWRCRVLDWRVPMRRVLFLPSFDVAEILMLATSVLLIAALVYVI